jgi:hypothetical protein
MAKLYILLVALLIINFTACASSVCSENLQSTISHSQANKILKQYDTKFKDLPSEIQLAIKNKILYKEELEAYITISQRWFAKAPIIRNAFQASKFYRKFLNDPKLLQEFYSNVASGGLSTTLAHKAGLIADPVTNAPIYTVDMLAGLILDTELTLLTSKAPRYYQELIAKGLVKESPLQRISNFTKKGFNKTFTKVNTKFKKHILGMSPIIEKAADRIARAGLKTGQYTQKYFKTAKLHIKNMLSLSAFFGIGGYLTANAYMGIQKVMYRFGGELADPYNGFTAMAEVEHLALFAISSYSRMLITKKIATKTEGFLNRVLKLNKSKNLSKISKKLTGDEEKFAKAITGTVVFSSVFSVYFMNNLWGATLYMKYRDGEFDPSYIYNPYQNEIKSYWAEINAYYDSPEVKKDLEEIRVEVNNEGNEICNTENSCEIPVQ